MNDLPRPRGLAPTALLVSVINTIRWLTIGSSTPDARFVFLVASLSIISGYYVIGFFWKGERWARILVLLISLVGLYNLRYWHRPGVASHIMIATEAILAIFLLYWFNTVPVKKYFGGAGDTQAPNR